MVFCSHSNFFLQTALCKRYAAVFYLIRSGSGRGQSCRQLARPLLVSFLFFSIPYIIIFLSDFVLTDFCLFVCCFFLFFFLFVCLFFVLFFAFAFVCFLRQLLLKFLINFI